MSSIAAALDEVAARTGFSGVVRVDRRGEVEVSAAHGFAHRGLELPNNVDTQFAIASGGKGLTALMVISLVVEGVLTLDKTARTFLGDDLPLIADDVTVEHLLAHRSGIGDYLSWEGDSFDATDYVLASPVHQFATTEGFLPDLDGRPTEFEAGTRFAYCDAGYVVLALIAERATSLGYHELVTERVLRPAGMSDTAFLRSDEPSERMALGYLRPYGLRTNVLHLPVRGNGDGGVYTTASDMHRFWGGLYGGRIVPAQWVAEMTRPRSDVPAEKAKYGLGFWLGEAGPTVTLVGSDAGVSFYSAHDPTADVTCTVISNATEGAWPIVEKLQAFVRA